MQSLLNVIHWNIDPEIFHIGTFALRYYALCWLAAFVCSYFIMLSIFKKEGKTQEQLDQLTLYIFLGTLIGARLGHCLFYEFDYYKHHLLEMLLPIRFENGKLEITGYAGLASHGGAIGIIAAIFLYCRKTKTNFLWLCDRIVLVVPLAGALIRIGNFFNSEMIGNPTDAPWAVVFEKIDPIPRHPGQLYEAFAYILIFIIMYALYKKNVQKIPGKLFGIFLILLFSARFGLEYFKIDQESFEKNMLFNMGQLLSIPFILIGFYLLFRNPAQKN